MDTEVILKDEYEILSKRFRELLSTLAELHAFTSTINWDDNHDIFETIKEITGKVNQAYVMINNYKINNAYAYIASKYIIHIISDVKIVRIPSLTEKIHDYAFNLDSILTGDLAYITKLTDKTIQQCEWISNVVLAVRRKLSSYGVTDEGSLLPSQAESLFNPSIN